MALTVLKLVGLAVFLNLVRYFVGGPIEGVVLARSMHEAMALYPEIWNAEFSRTDFYISLVYNFALWFVALVQFHLMAPALKGPVIVRSLVSFGSSMAFFMALAAVYMNHFVAESRAFFAWSLVDALILFPLVAIANGLVYPAVFRGRLRVGG